MRRKLNESSMKTGIGGISVATGQRQRVTKKAFFPILPTNKAFYYKDYV